MSKRLSFLICGAQKSGTTALAAYMRQHPGIHLPKAKEIHFFDDETQTWPKPNLNALHDHFKAADADQLWGEATPITIYWDPAAERVWRYNPAMRLIVILRNPIELLPHWAMENHRGNDPLPSPMCWNRKRLAVASTPLQHRVFSQ